MAVDPLNAQPGVDELLYQHNNEQQAKEESSSSRSRWLGEIGVDIRSLATSIRQTASGVATFVHRSALTVAEEIARLEEEEEGEEEEEEEENEQRDHHQRVTSSELQESKNNKKKEPLSLRLPWELLQPNHDSESCILQQTFVEDAELKRRILRLSHDEASFLQPHRQVLEEDEAMDSSRVDLIQRLLQADPFLTIAHKNLQSSISEATFWCNYFESCSAVRQKYLQDQLEALDDDQNKEDGDDGGEEEEEDSFVCIDASVRSARSAGMRSVDSLVLVESRFANNMKV